MATPWSNGGNDLQKLGTAIVRQQKAQSCPMVREKKTRWLAELHYQTPPSRQLIDRLRKQTGVVVWP
jgi:hypothetical protein